MLLSKLLFAALLFTAALAEMQWATVYYTDGLYSVSFGTRDPSGAAFGSYNDTIADNGWSILDVSSNADYMDEVQLHAAGYLEGALTQRRIYQQSINFRKHTFGDKEPEPAVIRYLTNQMHWISSQILEHRTSDYWKHVGGMVSQFNGLVEGYTHTAPAGQRLRPIDLLLMVAEGDLYEIRPALRERRPVDPENFCDEECLDQWHKQSSCSAFIKPFADGSDMAAGHTTWTYFAAMLRIYKQFYLPLHNPSLGARRHSFSSKPAMLYSKDDFYLLDNGLVIMETTNSILNHSLYDYIQPQTLLTWMRVPIANRMARNAREWTEIFKKHNSGTYCNQWMVFDTRRFIRGSSQLPRDTVWIIEQIPGFTDSSDVSEVINKQGYWPSYNIPYSKWIYQISGYPEAYRQHGDHFSYEHSARAKIFRRDQAKVRNFEDAKRMLRYNNWQTDPLSKGLASNAIDGRYDLNPHDASALNGRHSAFGGIDTKATTALHAPSMLVDAQSGPTHDQQKPFCWSDQTWKDSHVGHPDCFNFPWITLKM